MSPCPRIDGRVKRPFSVFQKLRRQKILIDQVYDLMALRILTDSVKNCYAALGVKASGLPVEIYRNGPEHVYVALGSEADVAALRPDMGALAAATAAGAYCFAGSGRHWKSRMFAPAFGFDEDPATGAGAGPLAVHLARHGRIGFGEEIEISQGVEMGRPSKLYARAEGGPEVIERVQVGGGAVVVAEGIFHL